MHAVLEAHLARPQGHPQGQAEADEQVGRADGEDASETFHKISEALLKEYPNFTYAAKGDWYVPESSTVTGVLQDILYIPSYAGHNAFIGIRTVLDEDKLNIEVSLNLPCVSDEEVMLDIHDKCNMLTLMTAAPFQVTLVPSESSDLSPSGDKIKAFVLYHYDDFKTMSEEDIVGLFSTSLEIFASYYTDICQNYYPAIEDDGNVEIGTETGDSSETGTDSVTDPLAAALGSKLTYRPAADVQGPQIIYKEGGTPASTDFITKAIQGYGTTPASDERTYENETASNISADSTSAGDEEFSSFVNKAALEGDDEEIPATRVDWLGIIDGYAKELLEETETKNVQVSAVDKAKDFLIDLLSENGKMPSNEINQKAEIKNISWASVRRAKGILKIVCYRENNKLYWALPDSFNDVPQLL